MGGQKTSVHSALTGTAVILLVYRTVEHLSVEAGAPIYSARTPANNTSSSPVPHSTFCRFPSSRGLRRDQGRGGTWLVMEVRTTEVKEASCKHNVIITSKGSLEPGRKAGVDQPFPTISCYGKNQGSDPLTSLSGQAGHTTPDRYHSRHIIHSNSCYQRCKQTFCHLVRARDLRAPSRLQAANVKELSCHSLRIWASLAFHFQTSSSTVYELRMQGHSLPQQTERKGVLHIKRWIRRQYRS